MCKHTITNSTTKVRNLRTNNNREIKYFITLDWLEVTLKQKQTSIPIKRKDDGTQSVLNFTNDIEGVCLESQATDSIINQKSYCNFLTYSDNGEPSDVVVLTDNIRLQRKRSKNGKHFLGSKSYSAQYDVKYNGEDVAILHTCSRYGRPELSQLKILNYLLYTDSWNDVLTTITDALHAEINNVTRLDIAIDGYEFIEQHLTNRDKVRSGIYKKIGKAKTNLQEDGNYQVEGFNIGTRKSSKMATGYKKGLLLLKAIDRGTDHKQYIIDGWQKNGLIKDESDIKNVERLELKITARAIAEIKDFDIDELLSPSYLAGIFKRHCNNFYQWIEKGSDSNTTRTKKNNTIEPIDWQYFDALEVEKTKVKPQPSVLWSVRMHIAFAMREYYSSQRLDIFNDTSEDSKSYIYCSTLAKEYGIIDWFERSLVKWRGELDYQNLIHDAIELANLRKAIY